MSLLILCQILVALSVIMIFFGPKILFKNRYVRYKDEKLESASGVKTSSNYIALIAGCIGGAGIAYAVTGSMLFTLLGLSGGFFALKWMQKKQEEDRKELLRQQYPDILSQLEAASRGNLNPYQALEDTVPNLPRPARDIFYEVLRRVRTGQSMSDSLDDVIKETGWRDLKTLSLAFKLNSRMGIDISKICNHAIEAHYDKESQQGQIRAATSQNAATIKVLSGLPFFIVGVARAVSPEFAAPLFNTLGGGIFFALCVLMIVMGNLVAKNMIVKTLEG
ncbi:type II secretion system F family protein [Desulfofalx alkaliphila]|uniref:type II secretion system F family protein n=1 Tax=Desulfofalx alkaliphila TaxID=105483 RepID=UPI0004E26217|nr:type II secretion system F family protein [Desulfofalx alkaliphila]